MCGRKQAALKTTCIVHMGMHKAGSSAIQETLFENRDVLRREHGINYYDRQADHSVLYALFGDHMHDPRTTALLGGQSTPRLSDLKGELYKHLASRVFENTSPYFILSGDCLAFLELGGIAELAELIEPNFDDVHIHISVTDPFTYANTFAAEHIKAGANFEEIAQNTLTMSYPDFMPPMSSPGSVYTYYRSRIETFGTIFGAGNVHIHPAAEDDTALKFLQRTTRKELSATDINLIPARESLSTNAIYMIEALNKAQPERIKTKHNPARARSIVSALAKQDGARDFILPGFDFSAFAEMTAKDVAWLNKITHGRVDYTDIAPPAMGIRTRSDLTASVLTLNDALLASETHASSARIYRALWQAEQDPEHAKATLNIEQVVAGCNDIMQLTFLAENLNRLGLQHMSLAVLRQAIRLTDERSDPFNALVHIKQRLMDAA